MGAAPIELALIGLPIPEEIGAENMELSWGGLARIDQIILQFRPIENV